MSVDRPMFIVGCPRSGTTLLSLMIHAHPRLAMPPETRFLISLWRRRHRYANLADRAQRQALAQRITRKNSIKDLGMSPAYLQQKILEGPATLGSAFGTVFQEFAQLHGKQRWGDKRPAYFAEVDVLLRLFPDAQIIHVVRDGRDNVASLKRMPWWKGDSLSAMARWSLAEYCARRNQRRLPPDVFHVIHYEALVADPRDTLTRMCAFLGEDLHDAMLAPHLVAETVPDRKHWHDCLREPISDSRIESWRRELEPWELGLMEAALRRQLSRNGYELSGLGRRPRIDLLSRYVSASAKLRSAARRRWAQEAREARRDTVPVAAQLTSGQIEGVSGRGV